MRLLTDVAEIADQIAINFPVIGIVNPINQFLNQLIHILLPPLFGVLTQVGGVESQHNAGRNAIHINTSNLVVADEAA